MNSFFRTYFAQINKLAKIEFFRPSTIIWNILLPLGWFFQFYFIYLQFPVNKIAESLFNIQYSIPLINFTLTGQFIWIIFIDTNILSGVYFMRERFEGNLEVLLLTPAPRLAIMLGAETVSMINFLWFFLVFLFLSLIFKISFFYSSIFLVLFATFICVICLMSLGIFFQSIFISSRLGHHISTIMQEPSQLISGLIFPVRFLPRYLFSITIFFPLTIGLFVMRGVLFGNVNFREIEFPLVLLVLLSAIWIIIGVYMLNYLEKYVKKTGNLTFF